MPRSQLEWLFAMTLLREQAPGAAEAGARGGVQKTGTNIHMSRPSMAEGVG